MKKITILIATLMALLIVLTIWARADQIIVPPEAKAIMEKWASKPCVGKVWVDISATPGIGDGKRDFWIYFLDDPATDDLIDAMAFVTLDGRLWGFVGQEGESLIIKWMDPTAPEVWRKWLQESIKAEKSPSAPYGQNQKGGCSVSYGSDKLCGI